jgi:hypothetical protein
MYLKKEEKHNVWKTEMHVRASILLLETPCNSKRQLKYP